MLLGSLNYIVINAIDSNKTGGVIAVISDNSTELIDRFDFGSLVDRTGLKLLEVTDKSGEAMRVNACKVRMADKIANDHRIIFRNAYFVQKSANELFLLIHGKFHNNYLLFMFNTCRTT